MPSIYLDFAGKLFIQGFAANHIIPPVSQPLNCSDNLSTLGLSEWLYLSHNTCLQTFYFCPGESLTPFYRRGTALVGIWNESSCILSPLAPWNNCSHTLSPWAYLNSFKYKCRDFEIGWQESANTKPCLNLDINLCHLELYNQLYWWWIHFKTSPLIELYARIFLTLLDCFDIVLQRNNCAIKVFEIGLKLKRNLIRKHDYALFMKQGNGASAIIISPVQLTCTFLIYHIEVFHLIELYLVIGQNLATYYFDNIITYAASVTAKPTNFNCKQVSLKSFKIVGGGSSKIFTAEELQPFINISSAQKFKFISYLTQLEAAELQSSNATFVSFNIPLNILSPKLAIADLKVIAKCHQITVHSKIKLQDIQTTLSNHICHECEEYITAFEMIGSAELDAKKQAAHLKEVQKYQVNSSSYKAMHLASVKKDQASNPYYKISNLNAVKKSQASNPDYKASNLSAVKKSQANNPNYKITHLNAVKQSQEKQSKLFPPIPPSKKLEHTIISDFCKDTATSQFIESGCAVCGKLTPRLQLQTLSKTDLDLNVLIQPGMSQKERTCSDDPLTDIEGPILDHDLDNICKPCFKSISQGKVPLMALANGKWIGKMPLQLQGLSFAEQLLVARVRHNRCLVRVSSGMHKMRANAITFANPMPKIYDILPPPIEEMDDVLAFIYTGPCMPTKSDFERTPLLVRRKKVSVALEWLKLNHCDYFDLEISYRNLSEYPEDSPPVVVDYQYSTTNKNSESTAVNDMEAEDGTETGPCPFVVHGLTGEEFSTKSLKAIKAIALQHLTSDGKILAIGHEKQAQSIYKNPQLFPQMMPWLFPYGLGGIGNFIQQGRLSDIAHKRHLLMYHDKRFQKDSHFALIAFNHEQIKESTTAGYLLAEKPKFDNISKRLLDVDMQVLTDLIKRMEDGERVKPETDEEKLCFQLIKDLDHVGGHVKGSTTSKKYMRNEIWSLISFAGAPSWFITFSPADNMHPISLYFADTKETFSPTLRSSEERYMLIAHNPVAGARFFHFMCEMFIKHILGVGENHPGIYGNTGAYYGTVEQQGRLTLHMHMLLWLRGSLTPQETRDKIMDPTSDFQQKMVEYLESVHVGEFLTGTMDEVKNQVDIDMSQNKNYTDPTQTLPESPPSMCKDACKICLDCKKLDNWWSRFNFTVDDLMLRSNVHNCSRNQSTNEKTKGKTRPTCINKQGKCKARFPRPLFEQTEVDPKTGALNVKKGEAWINTLTPLVTFLLRCNTDVTSLLSGTAIKAIVAYISDYVTKPGLKTHTIFDAIKSVFDRSSEMLSGTLKQKDKARKILTQTVNFLTAKMEIGGPMSCLYLLGNPDHYTSHKFVPVYWKNYVREVLKSWRSEEDLEQTMPEKVVIQKGQSGEYIGFSSVHDYLYRPKIYEDRTMYEWVQMASRIKVSKSQKHDVDIDDDELDLIPAEVKTSKSKPSKVQEYQSEAESDDLNLKDNDTPIDDNFIIDNNENQNIESDTEKNIEKLQPFLKDHPLYKTHKVHFDEKKNQAVPNFVGGSLPRCDRGDREYYCATMLTLFKPWRSGETLKDKDYSWDETFNNYAFTPGQLQVMKNFNIRYECNDARDDYSAQLKRGDTSGGSWMTSEMLDDLDDIDPNDQGADFGDENHEDEEYGTNKYAGLGKIGKSNQDEMDATRIGVKEAGWLDDSPNGLDEIDKEPIQPTISKSSNGWKTAVSDLRQKILGEKNKNIPINKSSTKAGIDPNENNVKVVDQEYLTKDFKARSKAAQKLIEDTIKKFLLNAEQERAFRIVANHAVQPQTEQLKMYLGGMGGTGKSQVIKAMIHFFTERNESHRFAVLGPTGTSAALLGGSTYHSYLGVQTGTSRRNEATSIAQLKGKLDGVEYIFIDEVSMLACHEMYKISAQLAKALGIYDLPFGGMNMIFAGDFAQLPPVGGASLYSNQVGTQNHAGLKPAQQEAAIGKALWHQITTVVILRENMRQKTQTLEDAALRTALVNMRYGRCTTENICFLKSRVAGKRSNQPNIAAKEFRNVAIICGRHTQKDQINLLGSQRFAADTNQKLTNFYSIDKWGKDVDPADKVKWGKSKATSKQKHKSNEMEFDDQLQVWKVRHGATDNFPGKLSLCIGMPVMIRNNDATELCITKGQEGSVAGWNAKRGPHGKHVLETLFVKLNKPPKDIQIEGLPMNVVPIVMATKTIPCVFPNDLKESIERQQLWILPNFAMTDYAAQGKTRPYNVVHLNSCRSHMSYYTALSRSASAAGTIIVQGFDPSKITRGCSGHLRQEFREHEILDDVTKLRYEGKLPDNVQGILRNTLIRTYQIWKGTDYVPEQIDEQLKWSANDPMNLLPIITDSPWQMTSKDDTNRKPVKSVNSFVPAKGSVSVVVSKHALDENPETLSIRKKRKTFSQTTDNDMNAPLGLQWDSNDYSCSYDALFGILYNIWIQNPDKWQKDFDYINEDHLGILAHGFDKVRQGETPLEAIRDAMRIELHKLDPEAFPMGENSSSVGELAFKMLSSDKVISESQLLCSSCDYAEHEVDHDLGHVLIAKNSTPLSTLKWVAELEKSTKKKCPDCSSKLVKQLYYTEIPKLMIFEYPEMNIKTSHKIKFKTDNQKNIVLHLRGIVYHGENHFTSRIISQDGDMWFHDGMTTGTGCENDGHLRITSDKKLYNCKGRQLVLAVYAQS